MNRKIKVLSIDDEVEVHDIVSQTLPTDEFEVRTSGTAREGLRELLRFKPDLVLLDYIMPEVSGMDALTEMKQHSLTRDIPVIVLSSSNDPTIIEGFYQMGAIDFVNKPVVPRILREKIRSIVVNLKLLERKENPGIGTNLVGFFGVKGGVGTSTIAANTALYLAQAVAEDEKRVLLLDNNCYYSSIKMLFDVKKGDSLFGLMDENPFDLDENYLYERLTQVTENFYVLPSIAKMGQFELVREEEFSAVLTVLSTHFDYIIFDMDRSFSESNLYIIENADAILLVTNTTIHSLQNLNDTVTTFKRIGIDQDKLALVLNMVDRNDKLNEEELMRYVGVACIGVFRKYPDKYLAAEESRIPVAAMPRSPVTAEYQKFTQTIIELTPVEIQVASLF